MESGAGLARRLGGLLLVSLLLAGCAAPTQVLVDNIYKTPPRLRLGSIHWLDNRKVQIMSYHHTYGHGLMPMEPGSDVGYKAWALQVNLKRQLPTNLYHALNATPDCSYSASAGEGALAEFNLKPLRIVVGNDGHLAIDMEVLISAAGHPVWGEVIEAEEDSSPPIEQDLRQRVLREVHGLDLCHTWSLQSRS